MKRPILGYSKDGEPIFPIKPGMFATAALVTCCECHHPIRSMGGPMQGAICLECWPKKPRKRLLMLKRYDDEALCDVGRDVVEAMDGRFNKQALGLPDDGTWTVILKWEPNREPTE